MISVKVLETLDISLRGRRYLWNLSALDRWGRENQQTTSGRAYGICTISW